MTLAPLATSLGLALLLGVLASSAGATGRDAPCHAACEVDADASTDLCTAAGDAQCDRSGRGVRRDCRDACPLFDPECRGDCRREAHALFEACVEDGFPEKKCKRRARAHYRKCKRQCEPPPPSCERRCARHAREVYRTCRADGGSKEACRAAKREALATCIAVECEPEPPTCKERCAARAEEVFHTCLKGGGEPKACRAAAVKALEHCVIDECEPDPPTCEERCEAAAREAFRACIESGGDPEACRADAAALLDRCLAEECDAPDPPTCEARCARHARVVYLTCLEAGEDEATCEAKAVAALRQCVLESCSCVCPDVWAPVCGVDGTTYGNECEARCAGVEIAHEGPCEVECRENADCPGDLICYPPTHECQPQCEVLCFRYDPVCGSDGVTYGCGAEDAWCHGARVVHQGECGLCHRYGLTPDVCPLVSCSLEPEPVCGVDGTTYTNACVACCGFGIEITNDGECADSFERVP